MSKKIIILNGCKGCFGGGKNPDYRNPQKGSVLIMAAEGHGFEESEYWYDRLEKHLGWKSLGKVLCGGVMAVGDISGRSELQDAFELGKSIQ